MKITFHHYHNRYILDDDIVDDEMDGVTGEFGGQT
jgi:hypothetical protein